MFDEEMITWSIDGGGRLFHRPKHRFSVTNVGGTLRVVDTGTIFCRYLYYVLTQLHDQINFDWVSKAHPSVIRRLYKDIPLPPLSEQKRIVAVLDQAFEGLSAAQANAGRARTAADELIYSQVQSILADATASQSEVKLGDVVDILDSRRRPITKSDRIAGPYPYYGATGIQDHVAGYLFEEPLVLLGEDGAKWGPGDRSAFAITGRTWVNNHAHVLRPHRDRLTDRWLIYALNSLDLSPYITGVTVPKLNQAKMREIVFSLPTIDRQREIVHKLDRTAAAVQELSLLYDRKLLAFAELKRSLLARAIAGELTRELIAA